MYNKAFSAIAALLIASTLIAIKYERAASGDTIKGASLEVIASSYETTLIDGSITFREALSGYRRPSELKIKPLPETVVTADLAKNQPEEVLYTTSGVKSDDLFSIKGFQRALIMDQYAENPAYGPEASFPLVESDQSSADLVKGRMNAPILVVQIKYDEQNDYNSRETWKGISWPDLLARAMLAEENEKLFNPDRVLDLIGAGWVMVNRTRKFDGYFNYAEDDLHGALVPYLQFALGGVKDQNGRILPGNAAIVANPEAYPGWFGGNPRAAYWKAYDTAVGILNETISDPTFGALYFADVYLDEEGNFIPFEDGRTRFWYECCIAYTIEELQEFDMAPWP